MTHVSASTARTRRFARLVLAGAVAVIAALIAFDQPVRGASSTIVISEFRVRGPNGGSDEFIELYNISSAPVGIGGWKINGSNSSGSISTRVTIAAGVTLAPGCHYLVTNTSTSGGPYSGDVPGDQTYSIGIGDDGGIALTDAGNAIVDQVGMSTGSAYGEGSRLTSLGSANLNRGYERIPGGDSGGGTDTDNNASDFGLVTPSAPQSLSSACIPWDGSSVPTPPNATALASPAAAAPGDQVALTVIVIPGANPASTGVTVTADLSAIGGNGAQPFYDDGSNGDLTTNDSTFSFLATIAPETTAGAKTLAVTVSDSQARTAHTSLSLTITQPWVAIHRVQGSGPTSPYAGQLVTTRGVVTARRYNNGFFLQTPDGLTDGDAATSEGIFVFTSSAPSTIAAFGAYVEVTGTVQEYIPFADPGSPPMTEIAWTASSPVTITQIWSDADSPYEVPGAVALAAEDLPADGSEEQLEHLEGMRVLVPSLFVVAPTDRSGWNETAGTVTSNGVFYGVIAGTPRPLREAGISVSSTLPDGAPAAVPRFDNNPERLRVDSDGQIGASRLEVAARTTLTNVLGVLDYAYRIWTILPDPGAVTAPVVPAAAPVPAPDPANEFTVASFNLERFYDNVNDPEITEPVLRDSTWATRLAKASLAIREKLKTPDIIGVQEVENLSTLQALAGRVNADAVASGAPSPGYVAYLAEGNDPGGIDVGLLVRASRVAVVTVTQVGKGEPFPPGGATALLNDRPPLVLEATVQGPAGALPITVIVNHLRSMIDIDDPDDGPRVRAKRQAQAEFLANLVQSLQAEDPAARIISVGDYNAFDVNDGYVDVIGTVIGAPTPSEQVVLASPDLVEPNLVDLAGSLAPAEKYSYVFEGTAQVLDHILVNAGAAARMTRVHYGRFNADFPESLRFTGSRAERLSDHDVPVAYFAFPGAPVLTLNGPNPMTVECCAPFTDPGATASDDDFGDISSWITTEGTVDGTKVGTYSITYSVTNSYATTSVTRIVHVVDTTAPVISAVTATPAVLWPANHKMTAVGLSYSVTDNTGEATCSVAVSSSEPANGTGDGDTAPDWLVLNQGSVELRAERAGTGSGREYRLTVSCTDASGNQSMAPSSVFVPKSAAGSVGLPAEARERAKAGRR